jgi:hypothetical protein
MGNDPIKADFWRPRRSAGAGQRGQAKTPDPEPSAERRQCQHNPARRSHLSYAECLPGKSLYLLRNPYPQSVIASAPPLPAIRSSAGEAVREGSEASVSAAKTTRRRVENHEIPSAAIGRNRGVTEELLTEKFFCQ